ncbi:sigma-70 family RNA polymerase sigma factor [Demequina sp.]|uniref:sigma-70 family RNA polymerase sigma factor n=1 Tax=Demequina sp. TaxID=2050685 RepID=UPI003D0A593B
MRDWQEIVERLVAERGSRLVAYGRMLVGPGDDAEDLVHDAIVKTFARGRNIHDVDHAEAYVRRVMPTLIIDRSRSRAARSRTTQRAFERERGGADLDAGVDVRRALSTLPPRERACVVLRFFDDLTVPQIAAQLGLAEGTVKRYLADASGTLASQLAVDAEPGEKVRVSAPGKEGR